MRLSLTMSRYLARSYLLNLVMMLAALLAVVYLFDTVELLRRASKREVPFSLILQMGILKLPEIGQIILPFSILFSAMFTFWKLTKRYELIVVRSAGFSVWQFLLPILSVAMFLGFFHMGVMNPISSLLLSKYEAFENEHLVDKKYHVSLMEGGLWLRQSKDDGYVILHGKDVRLPEWELEDVTTIFFGPQDEFLRRIDAKTALLKQDEGVWVFENAVSNAPDEKTNKVPFVMLPTNLTIKDLEESFASPDTMSFWQLPGFIRTMDSAGFDTTRMEIHFQSLLSQPLLFVAMILLAASVSLRPPRFRGTLTLIVAGLVFGFVVFFMTSFLQALGVSHQIPVFLAAWSPAIVTFLLGMAVMLTLEDG